MSFYLGSVNGVPMNLVMPRETEDRLAKTCFRGPTVAKAGNSLFPNFRDLLLRAGIRDELVAWCEEEIKDGIPQRTDRVSFEFRSKTGWVGWSSTAKLDQFPADDLEPFAPNKHSTGLKVKLGTNHVAPLTDIVTVVMEIKKDQADRGCAFIVRSLYPGEDVGELDGNISEEEGVAFFDWEHPGEPRRQLQRR